MSDVLLFFTCHLSENLRAMVNGAGCDPGCLPAVLREMWEPPGRMLLPFTRSQCFKIVRLLSKFGHSVV
jgi:hypothetical protein